MRAIIRPHQFNGNCTIPASKSHTIRRLLLAALAEGESVLEQPLDSLDARACVQAIRCFGALVKEDRTLWDMSCSNIADEYGRTLSSWTVRGRGVAGLQTPDTVVDVGNSGTTLYLAMALAALGPGTTIFTGDAQIRRRSAENLLQALRGLGCTAYSTRSNGCAPFVISGPWAGGRVSIECPTSQYLSALLLAAPLAPEGVLTEIEVPLLYEKPYAQMTLSYLDAQGIQYETSSDYSFFRIPGAQRYRPIQGAVAGDWSSAAFPACAAAVSGGEVLLNGLDPHDSQGDKAICDMLQRMGCELEWIGDQLRVARKGELLAADLDLNATPDALPVLAAVAAHARGRTRLYNVPNARIKETDRIAVMAAELGKLGIETEEMPDGLVIYGRDSWPVEDTPLELHGYDDHRVVMALAVAALGASRPVSIDTAESAAVTYPGFLALLNAEMLV